MGANKQTNAESPGCADTKKKPGGVSLESFYSAFLISKLKANVRSFSEMFRMNSWRTSAFQRLANLYKQDHVRDGGRADLITPSTHIPMLFRKE